MSDPLIKAVREKRQTLRLSLRALSDEVGVSFSALARLERGEGHPDNNTKIRLAEWLGADAQRASLTADRVAFVHFRAAKNADSEAIEALLEAADCLKQAALGTHEAPNVDEPIAADPTDRYLSLGKDALEDTAEQLRVKLGMSDEVAFDPWSIRIDGVSVDPITKSKCLSQGSKVALTRKFCTQWSAMSVPLNLSEGTWRILLNDCHTLPRQRVTLLEEYWHIILGHRLTRVTKIAKVFGRSYDTAEEHDAYFLAAATLLPKPALTKLVGAKKGSQFIADKYGVSPQLVDYRLKRLGLWQQHMFSKVSMEG